MKNDELQQNTETTITPENLKEFSDWLFVRERSRGTIEKYVRDVKKFSGWLRDFCAENPEIKDLSRIPYQEWKNILLTEGYAPRTINSMISSLNTYLMFRGYSNIKIHFLRIQKSIFRDPAEELTEEDYRALIRAAEESGRICLANLIECMGSTGIRVSEVKYITVEALNCGQANIYLKGKARTILLPDKLCEKLKKFAAEQGITGGPVFCTDSGSPLSRVRIWREMKSLCEKAGVEPTKVFPHNLRHLFASVFYRLNHDIVKLADLMGHSCVETTRIYLKTTGREHIQEMEKMNLLY